MARVCLRPWRAEDRAALAAILGDPEVMAYSDLGGALGEEQMDLWLADAMHPRSAPFGCWAIEAGREPSPVGYLRLSDASQRSRPGDMELGIRLARAFWGAGLAREAVSVALAPLSGRVVAIVDPANLRSLRLLSGLGFAFDRDITFPGYDHPDHLFALDL